MSPGSAPSADPPGHPLGHRGVLGEDPGAVQRERPSGYSEVFFGQVYFDYA